MFSGRGSSVSIVSRLRAVRREGRFPAVAGNFSLRHRVQTGSGAKPLSYPMGTGALFSPATKRPGRETDHSSPSSAEIKYAWSYTSTSPYVFMAWYLHTHRIHLHGVVVGQQDNFAVFYLYL
jgi:hypothetical protein